MIFNIYKYLKDDLRNDFQLTKEACRLNGLNLEFTSLDLQNNFEIGNIAMKENASSYYYLSKELKKNVESIKIGVKKNKWIFFTLSDDLRNISEIYMTHFGMYSKLNERDMKFLDINFH